MELEAIATTDAGRRLIGIEKRRGARRIPGEALRRSGQARKRPVGAGRRELVCTLGRHDGLHVTERVTLVGHIGRPLEARHEHTNDEEEVDHARERDQQPGAPTRRGLRETGPRPEGGGRDPELNEREESEGQRHRPLDMSAQQ